MANQYTRPSEYNPVIAPVDINLLQQSLATKQNQIDKGYTIIQDELDKYTQFDIYRPEDREYLKQKLDEKVKGINQMNGIDVSDVKSIYKLKSMAGELANDEKIVNARMSTARIRKEDQVADAIATNPKLLKYYNVANQTYYNETKQRYLNGEIDSFNEKFMLDTTKERLQETFKTLTPKQSQEIADNGYTIINNVKKTLQDLKNEAVGLATTDANVQKQLQIEYWYATKHKGLANTAKNVLDKDQSNLLELQTAYKNQITDLVTEAKNYKGEEAETYQNNIKALEATKAQIEQRLNKINTLRDKVYTGKDLSNDEEFQGELQGLFYEDYIENLASPYVISKTDRKANTGYIASQRDKERNFEFREKFAQQERFEKERNRLKELDLGLKAKMYDMRYGKNGEGISPTANTYPEFPVSSTEGQSPEEITKYTDNIVLNNVTSSQEKLKGNISELALSFIEDSDALSPEAKNKILSLKTSEQLKNLKEGTLGLSKAEVDIAHKAVQTIDGIMQSDTPVIPDNYKKYLPQIERLKDSQIEANYYSKWNPQEDAKYALTAKELEEYNSLTKKAIPTKTPVVRTGRFGAIVESEITPSLTLAEKKRKEQLDAKVKTRQQERMSKFNTRTSVNKMDIPEEGENPVAKEATENAKFSLNHKNSPVRPSILRILQEQGVTKDYFDKKRYAVAGSIQGLGTAKQTIITSSEQTDEFEDADVSKTQVLQIDDNGRIKVQLKDKDGNPKGTPVYVDASEDPAFKGFLNNSGVGYKPLGGLTKDQIIKEQRGAYNGDKLIKFSMGGLIPGSGINIPYVIMSDTQNIYFEFSLPNGVKVKTEKFQTVDEVKNGLRQMMSQALKEAKGDEKKAHEILVKILQNSK